MAAAKTAGPSTSLRSGRDDNVLRGQLLFRRIYPGRYTIFIPTGANPDSYFAMPATTTYAALLQESRRDYSNATILDWKSGGS